MQSRLSVRQRVLLVATLPVLIFAVVSTVIFASTQLTELEQAYTERGLALARQLASACEYSVYAGDREALQRLAASVQHETDVRGVLITDASGTILARAGDILPIRPRQLGENVTLTDKRLQITAPVVASQSGFDDALGPSADVLAQRVQLGGVVVELNQGSLLKQRNHTLWTALLTLLAVLGGSLVLAERMSRAVIMPIRSIATTLTRIGEGHLHERVQVESGGSFQVLVDGVNDMADRLESAHEDMTQKIAEATSELLRKKEEAERANLAKSRFLAAASHDLRQPMHALGLFIAELQEQQHPPEAQRLVSQIGASAAAMENLLDSLLDISRLDAGVLQPNLQNFALQPIFERIATSYAPIAEERGLTLRQHPTQRWARTDPVLLERILVNLVSNAIRYTPSGTILLGVRWRPHAIRIEVRDSGVGIAPEAQGIIFQEFVQLDTTERKHGNGLGLGLAIVKRLTDLLKLPLQLASAPGKGSTFAIEVPVTAPERQLPVRTTERPERDFGGLCVAIVEDDMLALAGLESLLRSWGCTVVGARDQEGLLAALHTAAVIPEIIIADYRLAAGHNGIAAVRAVRAAYDDALPALLISGDPTAEAQRHAQLEELVILPKPVRPSRLRALIFRLLTE